MTKRQKFILLLLLSLMSVFFAEVIAGSMPFPLLDLWGYIVVIPLYGLHTILLFTLINRIVSDKPVSFKTLYVAGMIFGLYEAYITKVLWDGLAVDSVMFAELAIIDFIVLVFFWHPIMSFIVPLVLFESTMTTTNYVYQGLPQIVKRIISSTNGQVGLMIVIGFFAAFNGVTPQNLFLSFLALGVPILLLMYLIRRKGLHNNYTLSEIMPKKRGIWIGGIYLFAIYLFMTFFDQFEVMTLSNQAVIWVIYLFFGLLFYFVLRQNKNLPTTTSISHSKPFKPILYRYVFLLIAGPVFVYLFWLLGIRDTMVGLTWIGWNIIGLSLFVYSMITIINYKKRSS